jgi:hypothetical protein
MDNNENKSLWKIGCVDDGIKKKNTFQICATQIFEIPNDFFK